LGAFVDSKKRIWVSVFESGMNLFDRKSGRFYNAKNSPDDPIFPDLLYVKHISEDADGNLWFAGFDGLCRFNGTANSYFRYNESDPNSLLKTM